MAIRLENQKNEARPFFGATISTSISKRNLEIPKRLRVKNKEDLVKELSKAVADADSGRLYDTDKAFKIIENAIS